MQFGLKEFLPCDHNVSQTNVHPTKVTTQEIADPSSSKRTARAANKFKPRSMMGPVEFANIMRRKYPNMVVPHLHCVFFIPFTLQNINLVTRDVVVFAGR